MNVVTYLNYIVFIVIILMFCAGAFKDFFSHFVSVTTGFLWNHPATDYEKRVEDLMCNFKAMGFRMSQNYTCYIPT